MLNLGYRKEAIKKCEEAECVHKNECDEANKRCIDLHNRKEVAVEILTKVDNYIHSLSNKPREIEKLASEISLRRMEFQKEIEMLKIESKKVDKTGRNVAGAGALAGAGVAAFGPTAAMGIATTFGTASTGTAIATLAGAAQTNAALAWLGGGALAAGGGGMSAGSAFLAMAGPVGWTIGGIALVGSGLLENSKNKKIAEKAERQAEDMKEETLQVREFKVKVDTEIKVINSLSKGVSATVRNLQNCGKTNYQLFTNEEKDILMQLMNSAEALSKRIGVKIS